MNTKDGIVKWHKIESVNDLPKSNGKYLVSIKTYDLFKNDYYCETGRCWFECNKKIWKSHNDVFNALIWELDKDKILAIAGSCVYAWAEMPYPMEV